MPVEPSHQPAVARNIVEGDVDQFEHTSNYLGGQVTAESFSSLGLRDRYADYLRKLGGGRTSVREIRIAVRRLDSILAEYAAERPGIDVLSVDVERWELDVLRGLSFARWRPRVVVIENLFEEPG